MAVATVVPLGAADRARVGNAGEFDYYVLSLSWSPTYCEGQPESSQCKAEVPYAFVVHGLWPQYERGGYPQYCDTAPGLDDPSVMLDIMPARGLISHEWSRHGTCSGLDADGYFALVRRAFESVSVPKEFQDPREWRVVESRALREAFARENPEWRADEVEFTCSGKRLREVRLCMDKELRPRACTDMRSCTRESIVMPSSR
jgi:ribonuclease T2